MGGGSGRGTRLPRSGGGRGSAATLRAISYLESHLSLRPPPPTHQPRRRKEKECGQSKQWKDDARPDPLPPFRSLAHKLLPPPPFLCPPTAPPQLLRLYCTASTAAGAHSHNGPLLHSQRQLISQPFSSQSRGRTFLPALSLPTNKGSHPHFPAGKLSLPQTHSSPPLPAASTLSSPSAPSSVHRSPLGRNS